MLHRKDMNWVVPMLLWIAVMERLITFHVYSGRIISRICFVWDEISRKVLSIIPGHRHHIIGGIFFALIVIIGAMVSPEFEDNTRINRVVSLAGYFLCMGMLWATSRNKRMINWHAVTVGILMQFLVGLFALRTSTGFGIFSWISRMCRQFLGFAEAGLIFLTDKTVPTVPWLALSVVPPIVFFAGIAQILSYWYELLPQNLIVG